MDHFFVDLSPGVVNRFVTEAYRVPRVSLEVMDSSLIEFIVRYKGSESFPCV